MPIALIFDQNPAVQALANHALKQLGYEIVARTGSLPELLEEFAPALLVCSTQQRKELRSFLQSGAGRALFITGEKDGGEFPNSLTITKPFNSEQLLQRLKELASLPAEEISHDVELVISDPLTQQLCRLALEARGIRVATAGEKAFVRISDQPEEEAAVNLSLLSHPLSSSLLDQLSDSFPLREVAPLQMPLSEAERLLLSRMLLKELEGKLSHTSAIRERNWSKLKEEVLLSLEEFFQR